MLKRINVLLLLVVLVSSLTTQKVTVFYNTKSPQPQFAVTDLKKALITQGCSVQLKSVSDYTLHQQGYAVVIAEKNNTVLLGALANYGGDTTKVNRLGEQAYALRNTLVEIKRIGFLVAI